MRTRSAAPLITYYGADGSRVELSGATASNAIHKAVNLFCDELLLDPGDTVWLDLPCHWQAPVLALAAWASGLVVAVGPHPPPDAAATLATGEQSDRALGIALAVPRHPFGMPLGEAVPHGWEDYAAMARIQPDAAMLRWPSGSDPWLEADSQAFTGDALLERAAVLADAWQLPAGGVLLSRLGPSTATGLMACTLVPALRRGSALLADVTDPTQIARQERNHAEAHDV